MPYLYATSTSNTSAPLIARGNEQVTPISEKDFQGLLQGRLKQFQATFSPTGSSRPLPGVDLEDGKAPIEQLLPQVIKYANNKLESYNAWKPRLDKCTDLCAYLLGLSIGVVPLALYGSVLGIGTGAIFLAVKYAGLTALASAVLGAVSFSSAESIIQKKKDLIENVKLCVSGLQHENGTSKGGENLNKLTLISTSSRLSSGEYLGLEDPSGKLVAGKKADLPNE